MNQFFQAKGHGKVQTVDVLAMKDEALTALMLQIISFERISMNQREIEFFKSKQNTAQVFIELESSR